MKTTLTPERLAELHAAGRRQADESRFVNPVVILRAGQLLRERGEEWAATVLLRKLTRRSMINPGVPWLEDGEPETLLLADIEEWRNAEETLK